MKDDLMFLGVDLEDVSEPAKLHSPSKMAKHPEISKDWVNERCEKKDGALTLVHESDGRAEVQHGVKAFEQEDSQDAIAAFSEES